MSDDAAGRMDQMYRFQRHIYDLTRRHYLLGRTTLISGLVPPEGGTVLEIGCGTGWNLIEAARLYPRSALHGFDVSAAMLETARRRVAKTGLQDRIKLEFGDATAIAAVQMFGRPTFDRIFASYVLSMIPNWTAVLAQAMAHVQPGGSVHIVDFGSANGLPATARVGLQAWLTQFDVTPRITLRQELDRLSAEVDANVFFTEMYRGYAQYAVLTKR